MGRAFYWRLFINERMGHQFLAIRTTLTARITFQSKMESINIESNIHLLMAR